MYVKFVKWKQGSKLWQQNNAETYDRALYFNLSLITGNIGYCNISKKFYITSLKIDFLSK